MTSEEAARIILGPRLEDPTENVGIQISKILNHDPYHYSSGEQALAKIALAVYNGYSEARITDISALDFSNRKRVLSTLMSAGYTGHYRLYVDVLHGVLALISQD